MIGTFSAARSGAMFSVVVLAAVPAAATTFTYSFTGAAYETFDYASSTSDQSDILSYALLGEFDASMRVTGQIEMRAALAPNLAFEMIELSADFVDANFSNGINAFDASNFSLLVSTDSAGLISDWSLSVWGGPGSDFATATASSTTGSAASYRYEYIYDTGAGALDIGVEEASAGTDQIGSWVFSGPVTPLVTRVAPLVPAPLPATGLMLVAGLGLIPLLRRRT